MLIDSNQPNTGADLPIHREMKVLLNEHFNVGELKEICFELSIDFDDLGCDAKSDCIVKLIQYLTRRERLPELVKLAKEKRPRANWPSLPDDPKQYSMPKLATREWEPDTLFMPAGTFRMGSDPGDGIPDWETPRFELELPDFRIGTCLVTNAQYYQFIQDRKIAVPPELGWEHVNRPSAEQADLSVTGVTWDEALAYCVWLNGETGRPYTLPTEAQWEKTAVCAQKNGQDIIAIGSIREWTHTLWGRKRRGGPNQRCVYPWKKPFDDRNMFNAQEKRQVRRVTRGGLALLSSAPIRITQRESELPAQRGLSQRRIGFRVALTWEVSQ